MTPMLAEVDAVRYAHAGGLHAASGPMLVGLARAVLSQDRAFRFCASGTSMSPFIRDGDVVTLGPKRGAKCHTGDVVAFVHLRTGRLAIHRVIATSEDGCRIRGDNAFEDDGFVPLGAIIGTVIRVDRIGREVHFGLGPERTLIALLSRLGWLPTIVGAGRIAVSVVRWYP